MTTTICTTDRRSTTRYRRFSCLSALLPLLATLALAGCGDSKDQHKTSAAPRSRVTSCNGSATLCAKRLDEVLFPGTHNSFAASQEPGWHFANQRYAIPRQLADGIRALLLDVHFGVHDPATGYVRTDLAAEGSDRNKVAKQVPAPALRLADRLAGRVGVGTLHAFLRARVNRCLRARGFKGAIVAVDFYQSTAVVKVARQLNDAAR
jgi:hypothetical protein